MEAKNYVILTTGLGKRFGEIEAVKNLNLKVSSGITFGLLGPNGAGKTTTIRMLNGLIRPTSGKAQIAGFDLLTQVNSIKQECGFLPENPGLYEKLTATEFLEFIGELYNVPKDNLHSRINELFEIFELTGRENEPLEGYSRGMKQKVCICSTLIQDPQIIFLDEPTSNLDPAASRMVKNLISELAKKANKTIFLCTHMLDIAEELCDRIGIINDGELKYEGTPNEIIQAQGAPNLEEAYLRIMGVKTSENLLQWRK